MIIVLADKFALVREHSSPKLIAQVNDTHVRIAKLLGEFDWHQQEEEDDCSGCRAGTDIGGGPRNDRF